VYLIEKSMKIGILTLVTLLLSYTGFCQQEGSVFTATGRAGVSTTFVTDYQALGINPSNLGTPGLFSGRKITMGYSEVGLSLFSSALTKSELKSTLSNFSGTNLSYQQKLEAAKNFASEPFAMNFDATYFGFSFQHEKIGGLAISIKEKLRWYSNFNTTISDIGFLGYTAAYFDSLTLTDGSKVANTPGNYQTYKDQIQSGIANVPKMISQLFDGSKISMLWYREYNVGYGRKVLGLGNLSLYAGVGAKYIQGFGVMDASVNNGKLDAFGAFTPLLNIDFGSASLNNPSTITQSGALPKAIGSGWGFDLGTTLTFQEKTKVSVAITDIGAVTYTGNVYEILDTLVYDMKTDGFNSFNFFGEMSTIAGESGIFKWKGEKEIKANLPSMLRIGASQKLFSIFEIGADIIAPINDRAGNFENAIISVGGDVLLFEKLRISTGIVSGGNYGDKKNIPVGFTFIAPGGVWEGGVASRDVITWYTKENPNISLAFGFLRFRI
jgi:hypothetical protein